MASVPSSLTLDQFVALNQELAMLTSAGVPLERGLVDWGRDWRGPIGRTAEQLGRQLEAGRSLPDALADAAFDFPPAYRATVTAGLRSGRLAAAFEGVARTAARTAESRRLTSLAFLYPSLVLAFVYALGLYLLWNVLPTFFDAYDSMRLTTGAGWAFYRRLHGVASWIWCSAPLLVVGVLAFRWRRGGSVRALATTDAWTARPRWPSVGAVRQWSRLANYAELLALLVEHEVPTIEALRLAGEASGDSRLNAASCAWADRMARGERMPTSPGELAKELASERTIPPLLLWLILSGNERRAWSRSLRQAAGAYREQADDAVHWIATLLPVFVTAVIGGGATIAYAWACFWPFLALLQDLMPS